MTHLSRFSKAICSVALGGSLTVAVAAQGQKPDNSGVNTRDRQPGAVTADQQKNNVSDRDTTKAIRQSIVSDKNLSTYAHNVKIVTRDGRVTLKGPVRTQAEKHSVEAKAAEVVGTGRVVSELSIAPETKHE